MLYELVLFPVVKLLQIGAVLIIGFWFGVVISIGISSEHLFVVAVPVSA
jgi:hypothetical protein